MNNRTKNLLLAGIIVLLLTACGGFDAAPEEAPENVVTMNENQANAPQAMDASDPAENAPTGMVAEAAGHGKYDQYIGLKYWSVPENLTQGFGMMIENKDNYGLSLIVGGDKKMLWLEKIIDQDSNGHAYRQVLDVLELSNLERGLTLIPDACLLNGVHDSEIIVAHSNGIIRYAWRANTTLGKFQTIPINGIHCDSDKATNLD